MGKKARKSEARDREKQRTAVAVAFLWIAEAQRAFEFGETMHRIARTAHSRTLALASRRIGSLKEGLEKLSLENLSPRDKKDILRRAHAAEAFRATFAKISGGHSVSTLDLEELMMQNRVRPSALLGLYTLGACALGVLDRGLKLAGTTDCVSKVVEDAVQQQFNDSIRDMQKMEEDEETKETLKFHRDVMSSSSPSASSASGVEGEQAYEDKDPMSGSMKAAKESAGLALYHILRTSSKI